MTRLGDVIFCVKGAIAHTAERVFQQELNLDQQEIARFVFLRLTELGEKTPKTPADASNVASLGHRKS